jgi:hypothetical protein
MLWINPRTLALTMALSTAGCAPLPQQVYAPDVPGGKVLHSPCTFNGHVPVGVSIAAAGIEVIVSLARHEGREFVEARFDVPEDKTLVLQDGLVQIDTADPKTSARAEFSAVSLVDTPIVNLYSAVPALRMQQLPIAAPLVGQQVVAGSLSSGRHFWLATYVETASAKDVWLSLPKFTVNGIPSSLPRLHFYRQPVVAIALFNC